MNSKKFVCIWLLIIGYLYINKNVVVVNIYILKTNNLILFFKKIIIKKNILIIIRNIIYFLFLYKLK